MSQNYHVYWWKKITRKKKKKKEYTAQTHKSLHVRLRMGQEVKELPLIFQGRFLPAKDRASSNYFAHTGYLMRLSTLWGIEERGGLSHQNLGEQKGVEDVVVPDLNSAFVGERSKVTPNLMRMICWWPMTVEIIEWDSCGRFAGAACGSLGHESQFVNLFLQSFSNLKEEENGTVRRLFGYDNNNV